MSDVYTIYLVRHGLAEERGEAYPDDDLRPLTSRGTTKFRKAAKGLAKLGVSVEHVLSSPLVRARQTADILVAELGGHPEIAETRALAPEASFDQLRAELESCSRYTSIALVGHNPSIGQLAARLAGLKSPLEMKKGAVLRVDLDALPPAGPGRLRWFLTQKMLARLG